MSPLIRRAVQYSVAQVRLVLSELRAAVTTIRDSQDVATLISNRLPQLDSEQFADAMAQYLLACRLTGMLSVQRVTRRRAANPPVTNGTFDQVFKSAVEALRGRLVLEPDKFLLLEREARSRAGRVAGEFNLRLVQDIYDAAVETLESGGTLRDFRLLLEEVPDKDGWDGSDPWHSNIVMHQNAMMAYSSGAYQEAVEIGAVAWTFEGYEDSCAICSPFIDKKFAIGDTEYVPPLHFNCDCWQSFHYEKQSGVTSSEKFRNPAYDESQESPAAFKYDPASFAKSGPFSLKSVPDELKPAFRRHAKQEGWEVVE